MRPVPEGTGPDTPIAAAAASARDARLEAWPLVEPTGLTGLLQTADLDAATAAGMGARPLADLRTALQSAPAAPLPHVHPDQSLALALERMGASGQRLLPVVSRANVRRLVGLVTLGEVLGAFGVARPRERGGEIRGRRPMPVALVSIGALVVVAIVLLAVADTWLARMERYETQTDAHRLFTEGVALDVGGNHADAVGRLREALSLARDERPYEIALARALRGADRPADAARLLDAILRRDADDAEANLEMARTPVRLHVPVVATSYYHRAIFGRWDANAGARRTAARLELVDLLAHEQRSDELLTELLPLEEQTRDSPVERRIAALYLTARAPDRSLEAWKRLRRVTPGDAEIEAGIVDAELARRNYPAAQIAYRSALRLKPHDQRLRDRLALCDAVMELDPTGRGLSGRERHERSLTLLQRVRDHAQRCPSLAADAAMAPPAPLPPRADAAARDEATEVNVERAERLWRQWTERCEPTARAVDEPLRLVLTHMSS